MNWDYFRPRKGANNKREKKNSSLTQSDTSNDTISTSTTTTHSTSSSRQRDNRFRSKTTTSTPKKALGASGTHLHGPTTNTYTPPRANSFRISVGSPKWESQTKKREIPQSPSLAESLRQEQERMVLITEDYELRSQGITAALSEKATAVVELARQAKRDEITIKELTRTADDLGRTNVRLTEENELKNTDIEELTRRIQTITRSLEILAKENIELKNRIPPHLRASFVSTPPHQDQGSYELLQSKIVDLAATVKSTQSKLVRMQQKDISHKASLSKYEQKIQSLQKTIRENMRKEAARRKASEFEEKRLEQKLEDLERTTKFQNRKGFYDDNEKENAKKS